MNKAIIAFSGDPITRGHINIIERASKNFDILLGIGENPKKQYTFTLEQRENMAKEALASFKNVEIKSFRGLLVDFAYENGIHTIIRGIRNVPDFMDEDYLQLVNNNQMPDIDTYFLPSDKKYLHVSSSAVKEIQKHQGQNIISYVPMNVKKALENTISNQYRIGITGEIGAGKSWVAQELVKYGKDKVEVTNIDFDSLGHEILEKSNLPVDIQTREIIIKAFGKDMLTLTNMVDVKKLGNIIFGNRYELHRFNNIMYEPMKLKIRRALTNAEGIVIINSALLAEMDMLNICNNEVILIKSSSKNRISRLKDRHYLDEQIHSRISSQLSFDEKKEKINDRIRQCKFGTIIEFENNDSDPIINKTKISNLYHDIAILNKN